ncbi:hypothetical protein ACFPER_05455 [Agromyces aurantiacus]|uniref:Uncharacterized protein n=1 Tax=Agromyces aurantiacus TaxID=165814 RepID=A0ABV9R286_9MICO|nr:hypothetical protein [Agromyces aurantiacus]MBM7502907.1 hypothetical protein [Agromyces aurantiacus]
MNTTLTATGTSSQRADAMRAGAGRLQERLARRAGLALLAWSRAEAARRSRQDLGARAQLQRRAERLRDENRTTLTLLTRAL